MTTASRPPKALATLGAGKTVAARSSLVQLVLHSPCAVGGQQQVLLGLLGHRGGCQDEGQGDCDCRLDLRTGAFLSGEQHAGPSRRRRAVRRFASMRFAEQLGRVDDAIGEDPNGCVGRRCVPRSRTPFLLLQPWASTCRQCRDVAVQAVRAEVGRLGPGSRSSSSGSSVFCSAAST